MKFFWEEDLVNGIEETRRQRNRRRIRRLLLLVLLLAVLSSSTIGYLIGRIVYRDFYAGQIVDTINIDFSKAGASEYIYSIDIVGRVQYKDGTPFANGTVELRSDPRYTVTNSDGRFEFAGVEEGEHSVSVLQDGIVLARRDIVLEVDPSVNDVVVEKLAGGVFLIRIPTNIVILHLVLEIDLDGEGGTGTPGTGTPGQGGADGDYDMEIYPGIVDEEGNIRPPEPTGPTDPEEPDPEEPDPTDPEEPDPTDPEKPDPEEPEEPDPTDPEDPDPEKPDHEKPKPEEPDPPTPPGPSWSGIEVSDEESGKKNIWSSKTGINIFSAITEHHNVQKIDGKTVIAPGSYASFVFQVKNNNDFVIDMDISLMINDLNNPKLPMIFRLGYGKVKRGIITDSSYVGGSNAWKKAEDITESIKMQPNELRVYTLQWEWDDSDDVLDTAIGNQAILPDYIIDIIVNASYP